ncbi:hypothetical protein BOX15_Mlig020116g1 [Macrostomum lignano]|uniref:non-specific serine/threonine protein kinase n=2 Tax=Macrostomum lignano TaxID=282301 RepID=A0A267DGE9_9PLAT|nr:hypothetical protein BOX15_Mlig020116g1 [Macrostomum lignano]
MDTPLRSVIVITEKFRAISSVEHAVLNNTQIVVAPHDRGLQGLTNAISAALKGRKANNIAFIFNSTLNSVQICLEEDQRLCLFNLESVKTCFELRNFFLYVSSAFLTQELGSKRVDFLACSNAGTQEAQALLQELRSLLGSDIEVSLSRELWGLDVIIQRNIDERGRNYRVGDVYYKPDKLRTLTASSGQSLAGFEKIRIVGKGAYGTAVLYRKKDDDSLVILKEINMHDLTAQERLLCLNEIKVLSMLDHPNIIGYFDSFEEDGVLLIEMEYADGGTLAQYLSDCREPLSEKDALYYFQQIVSAIHHFHSHKILHRDLKTANIFLTKDNIVKVGDFGIAKMMSTSRHAASTVLGTPYYLSPEMCEGKEYNEKSDIWALGCVLYEIACQQKTFEGSNLPALVNKIMKGQFAPVKGNYSQEFKELVAKMLLNKEPEKRPTAADLLYKLLPPLIRRVNEADSSTDADEDGTASARGGGGGGGSGGQMGSGSGSRPDKRSVLYAMNLANLSLTPYNLPSKLRIRSVCCSDTHAIAVGSERSVYSWGENASGQLGHEDLIARSKPTLVDALRGKGISRATCGLAFSVFTSDNGIVMTCGSGSHGCLGHGDWVSVARPKLIESLLSVDVAAIACGPQHVVAASKEGRVFAWGRGADGRTGLRDETDRCAPTPVPIQEPQRIRAVYAGTDGSMFLTDAGSVLATGNNRHNRLGLNQRQGFLMTMKNMFNKLDVDGVKEPTPLRALARYKVIYISMGPEHTAVLVEPNHVVTFGRNSEGQLGLGITKAQGGIVEVQGLDGKAVTGVVCGPRFTLCQVADSELLLWGLRVPLPDRHPSQQHRQRRRSFESVDSDDSDDSGDGAGGGGGGSDGGGGGGGSRANGRRGAHPELHLTPVPILMLNNNQKPSPSSATATAVEQVSLGAVLTQRDSLMVQVETTAPAPSHRRHQQQPQRRERSISSSSSSAAAKRLPSAQAPPSAQSSSLSRRQLNGSGGAAGDSSDSAPEPEPLPTWVKREFEAAPHLPAPSASQSSKTMTSVSLTRQTSTSSVASAAVPTMSSSASSAAPLLEELHVLRQEKLLAEKKLSALESASRTEAEEARNREAMLRRELDSLRRELAKQQGLLTENQQAVSSLQRQFGSKPQPQPQPQPQSRLHSASLSASSSSSFATAASSSEPRKSRVCSVQ